MICVSGFFTFYLLNHHNFRPHKLTSLIFINNIFFTFLNFGLANLFNLATLVSLTELCCLIELLRGDLTDRFKLLTQRIRDVFTMFDRNPVYTRIPLILIAKLLVQC